MVRMPTSLIERVDHARRAETDLPSRPEMIRRIVEEWFETESDDA
ncbi:ribbon-helix-helix protein, CopG family [Pontivivens nitratireducens]|uniref:Ribbon-helix-helix protein, CopG family n=1 Tax=Pontivivens nitratireducens TaxID=2758038 RepID=A0A6G7VQD3_9RHOB|nr:ribbon-helix-helix protein, CopG family [Pontibrevibacter nitratireducens]